MSKEQIESILNANNYLLRCKGKNCRNTIDCARKYLSLTVNRILAKPEKKSMSLFFLLVSSILSLTN
jgi:hypothetical protein